MHALIIKHLNNVVSSVGLSRHVRPLTVTLGATY
jgi:hypothetical protein